MCSFVMVEFTELIIKLPSNQWLVNLDRVEQPVKKIPSNQWLVNLDRRGDAKQAAPKAQVISRRGGGTAIPLLQ